MARSFILEVKEKIVLLSHELIMLNFLVGLGLRIFLKLVKTFQQHVNRKSYCCVHLLVLMKYVHATKQLMLQRLLPTLLLLRRAPCVVRQHHKAKGNRSDLLLFSEV